MSDTYQLVIHGWTGHEDDDSDRNKVVDIKIVRYLTGLGLKESKGIVDGAVLPTILLTNLEDELSDALEGYAEDAGLSCSLYCMDHDFDEEDDFGDTPITFIMDDLNLDSSRKDLTLEKFKAGYGNVDEIPRTTFAEEQVWETTIGDWVEPEPYPEIKQQDWHYTRKVWGWLRSIGKSVFS